VTSKPRGTSDGFVAKISVLLSYVTIGACNSMRWKRMMVNFKGAHFPKSVILYAVFFYVRYSVSYRDLQEIMAERGVDVDHAT
jgi:putative transposase